MGVQFVPYRTPSELTDAVDSDAWTLAMIGTDPAREEQISFTAPYAEIEATYLVPPNSLLRTTAEVDRPGHVVAAFAGSAYDLWLRRNLRQARLAHAESIAAAFDRFRNERLTAFACLKTKLLEDRESWPGSRILDGRFMTVQQSVGTQKHNLAGAFFLEAFVEQIKSSGRVSELIAKHKAYGLTVTTSGTS